MSDITVASIIERLGGAPQAAERLGVARTTVLGWRKSGVIPAARVLDIHAVTAVSIDCLLSISARPRSAQRAPVRRELQ